MCGFAGILTNKLDVEYGTNILKEMIHSLRHRGPDDSDLWVNSNHSIFLAHARLSIQDLSIAGRQPMISKSGRYIIVFNGEIYNHLDIRKQISIEKWNGRSDTETLLSAIETWGLESTLHKVLGMFSFALYDLFDNTLKLVRDRLGEKPLYYGWVGDVTNKAFVFGSELKVFLSYPKFSGELSFEAINNYLKFSYVPAPLSIYKDIYKLEPGCILTIFDFVPSPPSCALTIDNVSNGALLQRYWSLDSVIADAAENKFRTEDQAVNELSDILTNSVRLQTLADVSIGAFLSGGVDSSLIVSLMQHQSKTPIKTFTVGFENSVFDESNQASNIAKYLETQHKEIFISDSDVLDLLPILPKIYDEPFADASQIPTYFVSKLARETVSIVLSGDGADELFGGYSRYHWTPKIWSQAQMMPYSLRQIFSGGVQMISPEVWNTLLNSVEIVQPGEKLHKLARAFSGAKNISQVYLNLVCDGRYFGIKGGGSITYEQRCAEKRAFFR